MRLLLMFIAAALLFASFYAVGGWAQYQLDHMEEARK